MEEKTEAATITRVSTIRIEWVFYVCLFAIPLIIGNPQLLVGTVVNLLLFAAADKMPIKKSIPLSVLPSLGAVGHNILFGPLTVYLYYFLPLIWAGNFLLMRTFAGAGKKFPPFVSVAFSALVKTTPLFAIALLLTRMHIVPQVFLTAMGLIQFVTAFAGGVIYILFIKRLTTHDSK